MEQNHTIRLADGRVLGYAEYGDPSGTPLLFFHGGGASRLLGALIDEPAHRLGIRVITPDRPGIGLSDDHPRSSLRDWADDVRQLADHLELARFVVMGLSSGAAFVCACAQVIPERLTAAGLVSGLGPPEAPTEGQSTMFRVFFGLARRVPAVYGALLAAMVQRGRKRPDRFIDQFFAPWPGPDREVLARPYVGTIVASATFEGYRRGGRSVGRDVALATRPWGIALDELRVPVYLWHGEADTVAPISMARYVAGVISDCVPTYYPGEGHLSVLVNRLDEILQVIAAP
jgi:pimeloyl-ACP methyl ester carboxylesterase